MNSYLELLNRAPWLNAIFLCLAIAGIVVSVVLYRRSLRERRPVYKIRAFQLIRNKVKDLKSLEIRHDGKPISELTLSRVAFWNVGREPIRATDFAQKDLLRVVVQDGAVLLDASVAHANAVNNVAITTEQSNGTVLVSFDYLARNEGLTLNVYHTGAEVVLRGTFIGTDPPAEANSSPEYYSDKLLSIFDFLKKLRPQWCSVLLTVVVILMVFPIMMPVFMFDTISAPFRRVPRKFGLY